MQEDKNPQSTAQPLSINPTDQPPDTNLPISYTATGDSSSPGTPSSVVLTKEGKRVNPGKIIAVIISVLVLLGGIAAGVFLVQEQQDLRKKASEDLCAQSENCIFIADPAESGQYKVEGIIFSVFLTDSQVRSFDPTVTQDGCYQVLIEGDTLTWNRVGTSAECGELVNIQVWVVQLPTEGTPPVQSQCLDIRVYDTSWNLLTPEDFNNLSAGDKIRFTVSASTTQGTIDQAQFTINGVERPPVTTKKPDSNEFYDEYTISAGVSQFSVGVKLHHSEFGWF